MSTVDRETMRSRPNEFRGMIHNAWESMNAKEKNVVRESMGDQQGLDVQAVRETMRARPSEFRRKIHDAWENLHDRGSMDHLRESYRLIQDMKAGLLVETPSLSQERQKEKEYFKRLSRSTPRPTLRGSRVITSPSNHNVKFHESPLSASSRFSAKQKGTDFVRKSSQLIQEMKREAGLDDETQTRSTQDAFQYSERMTDQMDFMNNVAHRIKQNPSSPCEKVHELECELKSKQEECRILQDSLKSITKHPSRIEMEVARSKQALEGKDKEINRLEDENQMLLDMQKKIEAKAMQYANESIQSNMQKLQEERDDVQQQQRQQPQLMHIQMREIDDLKEENHRLRKSENRLLAKVESLHKVMEFEKRQQSLELERSQRQSRIVQQDLEKERQQSQKWREAFESLRMKRVNPEMASEQMDQEKQLFRLKVRPKQESKTSTGKDPEEFKIMLKRLKTVNGKLIESQSEMRSKAADEVERMKEDIKRKDMELERVHASLKDAEAKLEALNDKVGALKQKGMDSESENLLLQRELQKSMNSQMKRMKEETERIKRMKEDIERKDVEFERINASLKDAEDEMRMMTEQMDALNEKLSASKKKAVDSESENILLQRELRRSMNSQTQVESQVNEVIRDKQKLQAELEAKDEAMQRVISSLNGNVEALEESDAQNQQLREQMVELGEIVSALTTQKKELEANIEELQREKEDALHEIDDLELENRRITESQSRAEDALENERRRLNDKIDSLMKESESKERAFLRELTEEKDKARSLQQEINRMEDTIVSLKRDLKSNEHELQQGEVSVLQVNRDIAVLKETLRKKENQWRDVMAKIRRLEDENKRLLDDRMHLEEDQKQHKASLVLSENNMNLLREQLKNKDKDLREQTEAIDRLKAENVKLQDDRNELEREKRGSQLEVGRIQRESSLHQEDLKYERQQCQNLKNTIESLRTERDQLLDERRSSQQKLDEMKQMVTSLERDCDSKGRDVEEFSNTINQLKEANQRLTDAQREMESTAQKEKDIAKEALRTKDADCERLEALLNVKLSALQAAEAESTRLTQKSLEAENKSADSLRKQAAAFNVEIEKMQREMDESKRRCSEISKSERQKFDEVIESFRRDNENQQRIVKQHIATEERLNVEIQRLKESLRAKDEEIRDEHEMVRKLEDEKWELEHSQAQRESLVKLEKERMQSEIDRKDVELEQVVATVTHRLSAMKDNEAGMRKLTDRGNKLGDMVGNLRKRASNVLERERRGAMHQIASLKQDNENKLQSAQQAMEELKEYLKQKESEWRAMEDHAHQLQIENKRLSDKLELQESECKKAQAVLHKKSMEHESIRHSLYTQKGAQQRIETEKGELVHRAEEAKRTIETLSAEIGSLRKENNDLLQQQKELKRSNQKELQQIEDYLQSETHRAMESEKRMKTAAESERQNFVEMINVLRKENETKEQTMRQHMATSERLNREVTQLTERLRNEALKGQDERSQMEQIKLTIQNQLNQKMEECRLLTNELDGLKRAMNTELERGQRQSLIVQRDLEKEREQSQKWREAFESLRMNDPLISMKQNQMQSELDSMRATISRKEVECQGLQKSVQDNVNRLQRTEGEMNELNRRNNELTAMIDTLQRKETSLTAENDKLRRECGNAQHQHDVQQRLSQDMQRQIESFKSENYRLAESGKQIENLKENERRNFTEMIASLREDIQTKERTLQQHIATEDQLNTQLVQLKEQLDYEAKETTDCMEKMHKLLDAREQMEQEKDRQILDLTESKKAMDFELDAKIKECRSLINELERLRQQKKEQCDMLRRETVQVKDKSNLLQQNMTEMKEIFQNGLDEEKAKSKSLQHEMSEMRNTIMSLEQSKGDYFEMMEKFRQKEKEIRDSTATIRLLQNEKKRLSDDRTRDEQRRSTIEQSNHALQSELNSVQQALGKREKELQIQKESFNEILRDQRRSEVEVGRFSQKIEMLEKTNESLHNEGLNLNAEIEKLRREKDDALYHQNAQRKSCQEQSQQIVKLKAEMEILKKAERASNSQIQQLLMDNDAAAFQCDNQQAQLEELKAENVRLSESGKQIEKSSANECANFMEMVDSLRKDVDSKEQMQKEHIATEHRLNNEILQLEEQLKSERKETESGMVQIHQLLDERAQVEQEKDQQILELQEAKKVMDSELSAKIEECQSLINELDRLRQHNDHQCEMLQRQAIEEKDKFQREISELNNTIISLRKKQEFNESTLQQRESDVELSNREIAELRNTLRQSVGETRNTMDSIRQLEEEKEQLLHEQQLSDQEKHQKLVALEESKNALEGELHSLQADFDKKNEEAKGLQDSLNDTLRLMDELAQRNNDLETAMANLQRKTESEMQNLKRDGENQIALQERKMAQQERESLREIDDLKRKNERLSQSEKQSKDLLERVNDEIKSLRKEMAEKQQALQQLIGEKDKWDWKVSMLEENLKYSEKEVHDGKETIKSLREESRRLIGCDGAEAEIQRLKKQRDDAKEVIDAMEKKVNQISEGQMLKQDGMQRIEELTAQVEALSESERRATVLLENARKTISEFQNGQNGSCIDSVDSPHQWNEKEEQAAEIWRRRERRSKEVESMIHRLRDECRPCQAVPDSGKRCGNEVNQRARASKSDCPCTGEKEQVNRCEMNNVCNASSVRVELEPVCRIRTANAVKCNINNVPNICSKSLANAPDLQRCIREKYEHLTLLQKHCRELSRK